MENIVAEILTALMFAGLLIAMFFGFKYWVDKGGVDKTLTKINDDLYSRNTKLRKELMAYKRINNEFEFLLKKKQEEIEELKIRVELLKEDQEEDDAEQND